MGIETNPQSVDDLNEAWPAKGEPAKEGYRHLQNIKKAVKAKANAAGVYGVTTLTNALDSNSELKAASAKAAKDLRDLITTIEEAVEGVETALADLDTSVGEGAVPPNGLWPVEAGEQSSFDWRHPQTTAQTLEEPSPNIFYSLAPTYYIWWQRESWFRLFSFTVFNAGEFRLKLTAAFRKFQNDGQIELRLLKNGSSVWSSVETKSSIQAKLGGAFSGSYTYSNDLTISAGDTFHFEIRFVNTSSLAQDSFRLTQVVFATAEAPLLANTAFPAGASYHYITSGNVDPDLGFQGSF